jgi:DNA-binding NarL/FixJ family response regulator
MTINILITDDHKIVSSGIRVLLEDEPEFKVIGEAEDGRSAVKLVQELKPDLVIMDITMPNLNGIDATRKIVSISPRIKVLALSMHADKKFAMDMLQAGAAGYILKDCVFDELKQAIRIVLANKIYISPVITDIIVKDYMHQPPRRLTTSLLTGREREVLQLIAEGKNTKQIARALDVSIKTIETYRSNIMEKLHLHSIAELTKYAIREGLTSLMA